MRRAALQAAALLAAGLGLVSTPAEALSDGAGTPPTPSVDDAMLAPAPAPPRTLSSWSEAVGLLRSRSADLRAALDQVRLAEAQTRIALARYLPQLGASGVYSRELITGPANALALLENSAGPTGYVVPLPDWYLAGNVRLQQRILDVQAFDAVGVAGANEDAGRLTVEETTRRLLLGLASQILAVVAAERGAELNRLGLQAGLQQLTIVAGRQKLGGATTIDEARAEQNVENARAALVAGDETLRQAREALGLTVGLSEETGVSPQMKVDGIAEEAAAVCRPVAAVEERPDVSASRASLEAARRELRNVWFGFLPTVIVQSTLTATSNAPGGAPNPSWSVQGILTVPIWDGGARYGNLRAARATEDAAAGQLDAVRRQSVIEVERTRRDLTVAGQAAAVALRQRDIAARTELLTETAFRAGAATSFELVAASEAHRQAELNLLAMDFNAVRARLMAAFALATCP